jgi:hypothetical protein
MFQLVVTVSVQAQKMEAVTMAVRFALALGLDLGLDPVVEMKVEIQGILVAAPVDPLVFHLS